MLVLFCVPLTRAFIADEVTLLNSPSAVNWFCVWYKNYVKTLRRRSAQFWSIVGIRISRFSVSYLKVY